MYKFIMNHMGEFTLVAYHKGIAILKNLNRFGTQYVGSRSFDFKTNEWNHGHYFKDEEDALEWFEKEVKSDE